MTDLFKADDKIIQGDQLDPAGEANPFDELVGDGKKYKSKEELAYAALNKDAHIARIERENADQRKRLEESMTVKSILDKLDADRTNSNRDEQHLDEHDDQVVNAQDKRTPADVESLARKVYTEEQQKAQALRNQDTVIKALSDVWGNDFSRRLEARTAELGLSKDKVNELAATAPKALITMMIPAKATVGDASPPRSSFTPQPDHQSGTRNKSFYDRLKKSNPELYKSERMTKQRHDDAIKLGNAFFN